MALDKIVDSAQLDNGLAAVAAKIRQKGGTSERLHFPEDYEDAIDALTVTQIETATFRNNGTFNAPSGTSYGTVTVAIPSAEGVSF